MWWLIIRTPARALFCWAVGDVYPIADALINAARVLTGFPASDDWVEDGSGWDISLSRGDLHPDLLAKRPTLGTVADLAVVDPQAVAQHAADRAAWYSHRDVDAAAQLLAALPDAELAAVLADPRVVARKAVPGVADLG